MRAYIPGGRFDTEFEGNEILNAVSSDLTNPVGTIIQWYVFEPPLVNSTTGAFITSTTVTDVDSVYDVGSYKADGTGGRKWRDPVNVPVIRAVLKQGQAQMNERGFYAPDVLHLTLDKENLLRLIPNVLDFPDPLDRDRIVWKGQVYRPYLSQPQGIIVDRYLLLSFDCLQVMPEEMINDPQFLAYAR